MVLILLAGVVTAVERIPAIREKLPWLPRIPYLSAPQTAASGDGEDEGEGARGGRRGEGGRRGSGPIPVLAAEAHYADLPVTVDVLGTVQATNTVTVKSQVDGKLVEVLFKEGQDVKAGDVLARIDPATFQAAYDQAVAKKAQDDSILANAQADLTRYIKLAATQYGSVQQADTQKALVTQTQAILAQDQAAIESAKTTLDYATVRSPIAGRTGLRLVDAGNVVHAADATGLVTVTEVHPIATVFNLPQQYLRQVNGAQAKGPLKVAALDGGDGAVLDDGMLEVIDNTVDQTTGTVKLKGSFPNPHSLLWPGQFINVRLFIDTLSHVVVVPTTAIQRGPDGPFVYAVKDDSTVSLRKVTVGRQTEELSVVTDGLAVPTRIVTTGFTRLTDGAKVAAGAATAAADTGGPEPRPAAPGVDATPARGTLPTGQRGGEPEGQVEAETPAGENAVAQPGTGEAATQGGHRRDDRRREGGTQGSQGAPPP